MTDYTPTTSEVADAWTLWRKPFLKQKHYFPDEGALIKHTEGEFFSWLDEVRAEAWEAGRIDGRRNAENESAIARGSREEITNPYRKEQDR